MAGIPWDGMLRGRERPRDIVSPYDRSTVPVVLDSTEIPFTPGLIDQVSPLPVFVGTWCSWLIVLEDGGADLLIFPGRAGAAPQPCGIGQTVFIGDGGFSIGYKSTSPTSEVRIVTGTATDIEALAQGRPNTAPAGSPKAPASFSDTTLAGNGTIQKFSPGGTAISTEILAPGATADTPGNLHDVVFSSDPAEISGGRGIHLTPGSAYVIGGVADIYYEVQLGDTVQFVREKSA